MAGSPEYQLSELTCKGRRKWRGKDLCVLPATGSAVDVDKKTTNAAGSSSCELFNRNYDIALNAGGASQESGGRFIRELEWGRSKGAKTAPPGRTAFELVELPLNFRA